MVRRIREPEYPITPEARAAVTDPVAWVDLWGSPQRARAAWHAIGDRLFARTGARPEVWWHFSRAPKPLREILERPDYREVLHGPPSAAFEAAAAAHGDQERARLEWLLRGSRLSPGEARLARQRLAALDAMETPA